MISKSTYRSATLVAATIENHFARYLSTPHQPGNQDIAHPPSAKVIEAIIDTTFWASLCREEGHSPKISLAYLPAEQAKQPLIFEQRLPLTPGMLTKLAPGVERPGIHLGIWCENDELYVWGTTRTIPNFCFVLDVPEPGLLVIKYRRISGFGKFANVAVLIGDQIKIIDEQSARLPDCPNLLSSLLGFNKTSSFWGDSVNVLVQLAVSMRDHGRGGSLLVVPAESTSWRESITHPIHYSAEPFFSGLADITRQDMRDENQYQWYNTLRSEVDNIAGLTAIDGATIIDDQHQLLAFGAKISRPDGKALVEKIFLTEPIVGGEAIIARPSHSGGTRHSSAAQFVHDQHDCLAMVASQDGRFTIFSWSACEGIVQAHRIDTLLL